jgi:hypothetical protein
MNNMYASPDGAGSGDPGDPGVGAGPAGSYGSYGGFPSARARKKRAFRWGTGVTLAGFLAGGLIALALSGGSAPAVGAASTASAPQSRPGSGQAQGTALNSALSTASTTTPVPWPRIRWALARLHALGGVHGEFTFHDKTGFHTLAFERGAIQSVNGPDVVVRAPDGTTWTWVIVSETVIRESGSKTTTNALSAGEAVFAGGPVVNGTMDARLIVIRPGGSGSSGSGSSSSGSGSSSSGSPAGPAGTSVN